MKFLNSMLLVEDEYTAIDRLKNGTFEFDSYLILHSPDSQLDFSTKS